MESFWLYIAGFSWIAIAIIAARRLVLRYQGVRLPIHEEFKTHDQISEQAITIERMFQSNLHDMSFSELLTMADKLNKKQDFRKVVKYLEEALHRDLPPDHYVDIHVKLIDAYLALNDYPRALVVVNKLLFHFPNEAIWQEKAAKIQILAGRYEEAVKTLEALIDMHPQKTYLELLAKAYRKLKLHDKARDIYQDIHRFR